MSGGFRMLSSGDGLLLVAGHLGALAIATVWLWLMTGLGTVLLDRLAPTPDPADRAAPPARGADQPLRDLLLALALGAGAAATLLLLLGAFGLLRPAVVLGGAGVAAFVLAGPMVRVARGVSAAGRGVAADFREAEWLGWVWVPVVAMIVAASAMALAPVTDWDSLMYHLTVPQRWLDAGRVYLPADNLHASRTGLLQVLYVVPLALGEHRAATLTALGFALALCAAVYDLLRRDFGPRPAIFGGATMWAAATLWFVAVTPRNDVALVFFLLLAHDRLMRAPDDRSPRTLALAGMLLGLAVATKFQALPYAVALLPLAWLEWRRARPGHRVREVAGRTTVVVAAAALVSAPWLLKNVLLLGAPFYPLLADPAPPPWIGALAATAVPRIDAMASGVIWSLRQPFNLSDFFFRPGLLGIEREAAYYRPNLLLVALPLLLFVRRDRRKLLALAGPAALYLAIVLLGFPRSSLRYLLPGLVPLAAVAAVAVVRVLQRFPRSDLIALVLGLVVLVPTTRVAWRMMERSHAHRHAAGIASPAAFMERQPQYAPLARALDALDATRADAVVLMLFDARSFHAPRAVLQDNKVTNWAYLRAVDTAAPILDDCLTGAGITHILLNRGPLDYYVRSGGLDPAVLGVPALDAFLERCGRTTWERDGLALYELEHGGAAP